MPPLLCAMVLALAWLSAVAGCSRGGSSKAGRSSSVAGTLPAGVVGVSPAGVTTRVDAPAELAHPLGGADPGTAGGRDRRGARRRQRGMRITLGN